MYTLRKDTAHLLFLSAIVCREISMHVRTVCVRDIYACKKCMHMRHVCMYVYMFIYVGCHIIKILSLFIYTCMITYMHA